MNYEITINSVPIYIPLKIDRANIEAVKEYARKLQSDYPEKKIELWEITSKLVEL